MYKKCIQNKFMRVNVISKYMRRFENLSAIRLSEVNEYIISHREYSTNGD